MNKKNWLWEYHKIQSYKLFSYAIEPQSDLIVLFILLQLVGYLQSKWEISIEI